MMLRSLSKRIRQPALLMMMAGASMIASQTHGQEYAITDLGTLSGAVSSAAAISDSGEVVGSSFADSNGTVFHGFRWNSAMTDLSPLTGDPHSIATAINASGATVGISYQLGDLQPRGARWVGASKTNLGRCSPQAINAAGQIAGTRVVSSGPAGQQWINRAFAWQGGAFTNLGTHGGSNSYGRGISEAGWIVGSAQLNDEVTTHASLWVNGHIYDLGTLGGANSQAYAITNRRVVGVSDTATGKPHAFMFLLTTTGAVASRTNLGDLGSGYSYAYAINDQTQIVGASRGRAFLWENGAMADLNTMIDSNTGWQLAAATGINHSGWIVGYGAHNGLPHAFLLQPNGPHCSLIAAPTNVNARDGVSDAKVRITWRAVNGAATYEIWRKPASGGPLILLADGLTSPTYNDFTADQCVQYKYRVIAVRLCGTHSAASTADLGYRGTACVQTAMSPARLINEDFNSTNADYSSLTAAADLDGNGAIDAADLYVLISAWGPCHGCAEDLNADGFVDVADLQELLEQ